MKRLPNFKRGDTFSLACTYKVSGVPQMIDGLAIRSQIRTIPGVLISDLRVVSGDQSAFPGRFTLLAITPEKEWPCGIAQCDIEITKEGIVTSSETFEVVIAKDVTE